MDGARIDWAKQPNSLFVNEWMLSIMLFTLLRFVFKLTVDAISVPTTIMPLLCQYIRTASREYLSPFSIHGEIAQHIALTFIFDKSLQFHRHAWHTCPTSSAWSLKCQSVRAKGFMECKLPALQQCRACSACMVDQTTFTPERSFPSGKASSLQSHLWTCSLTHESLVLLWRLVPSACICVLKVIRDCWLKSTLAMS